MAWQELTDVDSTAPSHGPTYVCSVDRFAPAVRHDTSILWLSFDSMGNSPLSGLAFTLFCLVTVVMILRPGELVSGLAGLPIYEVLILSTFALAHRGVLDHFKPNA
jgi:hypothetical protein